jgi:hypothetical protein
MALNIRNPETEKLAETLAKLTDETKTQAVTKALRDRLERIRRRRSGSAGLMVIDTSALVAIMRDEPERRAFNEAIEAAETCAMSTASFVEQLWRLFRVRAGKDTR